MKVLYFKNKTLLYFTSTVLMVLLSISFSIAAQNALPATAEPYYNGQTDINGVSLAINVDWGNEYIPEMLKILDSFDVKATFFLTGRWASENSVLAKQISDAGHEIGNHGYSHFSPNAMSVQENIDEIRKSETAIFNATGKKCTLYAPPSGERDNHVLEAAEQCGYKTILWSLDTIDWKKPPATEIIKKVKSRVKMGDIILMHPTQPTVSALNEILKYLTEKGFEIVTVSENIGLTE